MPEKFSGYQLSMEKIADIFHNDDTEALKFELSRHDLQCVKNSDHWMEEHVNYEATNGRTLLYFLRPHLRGITTARCWQAGRHIMDLRAGYAMCGRMIALMFEMILATPELCAFNFWTGRPNPLVRQPEVWPLPSPTMLVGVQDRWLNCPYYPDCLHEMICRATMTNFEQTWAQMSAHWCMHRFGAGGDHIGAGVPSLRMLTRVVIRRQLIRSNVSSTRILTEQCCFAGSQLVGSTIPSPSKSMEQITQACPENYINLVHRLRLPESLKLFLIYEDLWPQFEWLEQVPQRRQCYAYYSV